MSIHDVEINTLQGDPSTLGEHKGKALLVVSSELPELIGLCRRIIVMRNGGLAGEVQRADFSEATLMRLMAGVAAA